MYRLKRYRYKIFEKKIEYSDKILLAKIFFTDEAMEKTKQNFFSAMMKRYNIPSYKSFTDEASSILENVSITAILKFVSLKAAEFSSQFGGKIGPLRKKVWRHSNFSFFFGVICTTEEHLSVYMCVKKVQYY
jgi:hypothetical protein